MSRPQGHWQDRMRAHIYNKYYARIYHRLNRCPTCKERLKTTTGYCSDACGAAVANDHQ